MYRADIKELLEELHDRFNRIEFIENDPISIPHKFSNKEDVEIAGFLSAILAWGQRSQIILKANKLIELMDNAPHEFVQNATENDLERLKSFYYRTFQSVDAKFFVQVLQYIYNELNGLEDVFVSAYSQSHSIKEGLTRLHQIFYSFPHEKRSMKHVANVSKGSSAKRLNMFLRWMIRRDKRGVDFGLWKSIPMSALYLPLDVHTGRSARDLNLLKRKQNDWTSVEEITLSLKEYDSEDPVKYDFALFGAGIEKVI